MIEFLTASIALVNLPFTVLLVLVILYWICVILGAIDIELFDIDMDHDVDMGGDVDMDGDVDVDQSGGFLHSFFDMMNIGEVPAMVVISVMVLSCWCISMLANYYLNSGNSLLIGVGIIIPNLIVSLFVAALFTRPLRKVFKTLDNDEQHQKILLRVGEVTTSEVNDTFGQLEIKTKGAPVVINVRTTDGIILKKGDKAIVYEEDKEKGIYFIEKYEE